MSEVRDLTRRMGACIHLKNRVSRYHSLNGAKPESHTRGNNLNFCKMRKVFLTLIAIIGFGMGVNAQCVFYINSGKFKLPNGTTVSAYSGVDNSKSTDSKDQYGAYYRNNSENTGTKFKGAIPTGTYYITGVSSSRGPNTIILSEDPVNDMYGRNNFRIHGDNSSGNASQGCIILDANSRQQIINEYNRLKSKGEYLTLYVYE